MNLVRLVTRELQNLLRFAGRERNTLSVGLSFTFFSSFGQTFLLSLFVPHFLETFGLTEGSFGTLYALATLGSALTLPYAGAWIDDLPLRSYGSRVLLLLALASFTVCFSIHVAMLFAGLYLLRLAGQGLSSHTAQTAMARHYASGRGKALSVINLGYPIGEAIFPLLMTVVLGELSWRTTWGTIGAVVLVGCLPLLHRLLTASSLNADRSFDPTDAGEEPGKDSGNGTSYREMVSEPRFWLLAPAVVLPGFWLTGLLLYQIPIARELNWTKELMATAFVAFAAARVGCTIIAGPAIDRWSARRLFPFYLVPLAAGLVTGYFHPGSWSAFLYMSLLGLTMGASNNLKSALWAELYGRSSLGTARSLYTAISVFGTAACPFLMGMLMDLGVSAPHIFLGAILSVAVALLLALKPCFRPASR